ncbi:MAG: hypothetical protein VKJ02_01335 [Snowella sp.]|nr:hypothetical protein [Snowella sp.]
MNKQTQIGIHQWRSRAIWSIGLTAIALSLIGLSTVEISGVGLNPIAQATAKQPTVNSVNKVSKIFQPIIPSLKAKTRVPLRLPSYIPDADDSLPLYAVIETANSSSYSLILGYTPDCGGGNACRLGSLSGEFIKKKQPLTGKRVKLMHNRTGYFTEATCGANCSDSTLTWQEGNYRYTVGIKVGDIQSLTKMANSTVLVK